MREVVTWVELEDEYVIDAGRSPAVDVDAEQEADEDDEERAAVHAQCRLPVAPTLVSRQQR